MGTVETASGEETFLLRENNATFVAMGANHALEESVQTRIEMIEIRPSFNSGHHGTIRLEYRYRRNEPMKEYLKATFNINQGTVSL